MPSLQHDLSIRGESVQRVYNYYINSRLIVNRRYQRKLVWSIEEKRNFIDSLLKGFPVPLILLAETDKPSKQFEIIDGMQRLNAIMSFIEGEFDYNGGYFDLNTMVESKSLLDSGSLEQNTPVLVRQACETVASYNLALSVYSFEQDAEIDEVFRRINSNGRYLSPQELRAAGALGNFAQLVRNVSSRIRGDVSYAELLPLNEMKKISITNRELPYGIVVDDIFWVNQSILTKDMVRESRDEEIVADLLAFMCFDDMQPTRWERFDEYFGVREGPRYTEVEAAVARIGPEILTGNFIKVFDQLRATLALGDRPFASLILGQEVPRVPRYFQVVFLALCELLITDNLEVANPERLYQSLENCGYQMNISGGGGTWAAAEKERNVHAIKGLFRPCFQPKKQADPAYVSWLTQLENILTQSYTEQNLYDFKQGFCTLADEPRFDKECLSKVMLTLAAMANFGPGAKGYVVVGVADTPEDADRLHVLHGVESRRFGAFEITGIAHEAHLLKKTLDQYFVYVIELIRQAPIQDGLKQHILSNVRLIKYFDKALIVLESEGQQAPSTYEENYYVRHGSCNHKLKGAELEPLFQRFLNRRWMVWYDGARSGRALEIR